MREILFRGKSVDTGKWIEGFYCGENCEHPFSRNMVEKPYIIHKGTGFWFEVISETVGQFTGLYDSTKWEELTEEEREMFVRKGGMPSEWKGKRIFEGDVVKYYNTEVETEGVGEVRWNEFFSAWHIGEYVVLFRSPLRLYEVVGCVYEDSVNDC